MDLEKRRNNMTPAEVKQIITEAVLRLLNETSDTENVPTNVDNVDVPMDDTGRFDMLNAPPESKDPNKI